MINKFPEYIGDKYLGLRVRPSFLKEVVNNSELLYYPPKREKTIPNYSIVNYNVGKCVLRFAKNI